MAFKNPLADFLFKQNKNQLLENMDELEDYIFDLDNVIIDVITSISLKTSPAETTSL